MFSYRRHLRDLPQLGEQRARRRFFILPMVVQTEGGRSLIWGWHHVIERYVLLGNQADGFWYGWSVIKLWEGEGSPPKEWS